jgi:hypothetical protein
MADALLTVPVALDLQPVLIEPPAAVIVGEFIEVVTSKCLVHQRSLLIQKTPQVPFGRGANFNIYF